MNEFLTEMADILEVESVTPETVFRDCPDFDSMKGFAIIVMVQRDYGREITVPEFLSYQTVGDIAKAAGL